jgi:hypothetical protein
MARNIEIMLPNKPETNGERLVDIEKDAKRYAFIRTHLVEAILKNPYIAGVYIKPPGKKYWFDNASDIDQAIDEAMQ